MPGARDLIGELHLETRELLGHHRDPIVVRARIAGLVETAQIRLHLDRTGPPVNVSRSQAAKLLETEAVRSIVESTLNVSQMRIYTGLLLLGGRPVAGV